MHVVAGFESQIAARGAALAVVGAARASGADIAGVALARRDTERGIHVDPLLGFELPPHVLGALDSVVEGEHPSRDLRPGQTALVVSAISAGSALSSAIDDAALDRHGALWVTIVALGDGAAAAPGARPGPR